MDEKSWKERIGHARARARVTGNRQALRGAYSRQAKMWIYYSVPAGGVTDWQLQERRRYDVAQGVHRDG
jgi:hypothetical protein